jgi:hypothetical protein
MHLRMCVSDVLTVVGGSTNLADPRRLWRCETGVGCRLPLLQRAVMHTVTGSVRVCVGLARPPLNVKYLLKRSIKELAALYFSERFTPELAKTYKAARDLVGPQGYDPHKPRGPGAASTFRAPSLDSQCPRCGRRPGSWVELPLGTQTPRASRYV